MQGHKSCGFAFFVFGVNNLSFSYQGIKKIKIPIKPDEIRTHEQTIAVFKNYLNQCLAAHKDNIEKMQYYSDVYEGKQDILAKTRP